MQSSRTALEMIGMPEETTSQPGATPAGAEQDPNPAGSGRGATDAASRSGASPGGAAQPEAGATRRVNRRKVREGRVVSNTMDKTAVVAVIERVRHPRYNKIVQKTTKVYAHDEGNDVRVGDRVRVAETRPLSKTKRWRIAEVLERAR